MVWFDLFIVDRGVFGKVSEAAGGAPVSD
ncbi:MAG: hypothetical protein V7633_2548, partial [Pseudonocardia sp.]